VVKEERELVKRVQALWEDDKTQEAIAGMHELVASDPTDYDLIGPHTTRTHRTAPHTPHHTSTDVESRGDRSTEKLGDMYLAVGDYEASERQYAASIAILQQHPTQGLQVRDWTPPLH
jgi:hypothetical protein